MDKLSYNVLDGIVHQSVKLEPSTMNDNDLISYGLRASMHDDEPIFKIFLTFRPNTEFDLERLNNIANTFKKIVEKNPFTESRHLHDFFKVITRDKFKGINLTFTAQINDKSITGTYQECCEWLVENLTPKQFIYLIKHRTDKLER